MRLLIAGDTHGNMKHVEKLAKVAKRREVDAIVQVGDFGFVWQSTDKLNSLNNVLAQFGIPLYWLDGNHENFDLMASIGAKTNATEMVPLTEFVTYLPRGLAWEWDGVRFMSMGGAFSIDKEYRTPGLSWWPQETITDADIDRAAVQGKVDVLLTHDAPELPPVLERFMIAESFIDLRTGERDGYKTDRASWANRIAVTVVMQSAEPKLLVHGHFHHRYNDVLANTLIVGLDRDTTGSQSYVVVETENLDGYIAAARAQLEGGRAKEES